MTELVRTSRINLADVPLSDLTKNFLCEHGLPKQIWGFDFSKLEQSIVCAKDLIPAGRRNGRDYDGLFVVGNSVPGSLSEKINADIGLVCVSSISDAVYFVSPYNYEISFMNSDVQRLYGCFAIIEREHLSNTEEMTSYKKANLRYKLLKEQIENLDAKCLCEGCIWYEALYEIQNFY